MNIDNLSVEELRRLEKQVSDTIQVRFEQEKDDLKRQIRDLAKKGGTTVEELFGLKVGASKRGKAAPKYRDPDDAMNTWSGRGRAPTWMKVRLEAGANKEDFLIK